MPEKGKKRSFVLESVQNPEPDHLWQADITYIWCGQDRLCYMFNVLDTFTLEWNHHTPEQNGHVESSHKSLKNEYVGPCDLESFQYAEAAMSYVFDDHNYHKMRSVIGYTTPSEFGATWRIRQK